ncbi:hypothetical protein ACROYT_G020456 [Oculina patagonica]
MAGKVDREMEQFILAEKEKVRFQSLVRSLTDECWEKCVEKVGPKLDSKTETCIVNCVERFLDTSNYVANRLSHMGEKDVDTECKLDEEECTDFKIGVTLLE